MFKKPLRGKNWFWPSIIGGVGISLFILVYGLSTFISLDAQGLDYAVEKGIKTLSVAFIAWIIIRLFSVIGRVVYKKRTGIPLPRFMITIFNLSIIFLAVIFVVVVVFERSAWSIIAAGGFMGAALAIALQGLIGDIFSGVVLDVENNYKFGDWVKLPNGTVGQVVHSSWRSVNVKTVEGNLLVIPNGFLTKEGFTNISRPKEGFYDQVEVAIDHYVPIARAERLLHGALLSIPEILKDKRHEAYAYKSTEGGILYNLRYYVSEFGQLRHIKHKVLETVSRHLHQSGFKISETIGEYALSRATQDVLEAPGLKAEDALKKVDLFKALKSQERKQLSQKMNQLDIGIGVDIIQEGAKGSSMFIVGEGVVEVLKKTQKNGKISYTPLAYLGPNQFFGDMALLLGKKRTATVRAKTNTLLFEVPKEALSPILKKRPEVAKTLSNLVAKREQETFQTMKTQNQKGESTKLTANEILKGIKSFFGL